MRGTTLFEGDEPLGQESRFYLLEGDLSEGIVMIIYDEYWNPSWNARHPDNLKNNHPSLGEKRYLRFKIVPAEALKNETLKIQGFMSEEAARVGFTKKAAMFRRN